MFSYFHMIFIYLFIDSLAPDHNDALDSGLIRGFIKGDGVRREKRWLSIFGVVRD